MPTPEKPLRLCDIAQEAGLSVQAVSMALRDHKRISPATRQRVREIADRLGYRADPALAALSRYRTAGQHSITKWETVALVDNWGQSWWETTPVYHRLYGSLQKEAERRGIRLHQVSLGLSGQNAPSVFRHLHNQGIRAVLVAPLAPTSQPHTLTLPVNKFNIVTFGPASAFPDQHVVQFDYFENAHLAWKTLHERGHNRIGLVYATRFGWRTGHGWLGAYLADKRLAGFPASDLQPLIFEDPTEADFRAWVEAERPDAIITILREVIPWNRKLKHPLPIASLSVTESGEQGINVDSERAATSAFELLLLEMYQSLTVAKSFNLRVHIPGHWVDNWQPSALEIRAR